MMAQQPIEFQRAITIFRPTKIVFSQAIQFYKEFLQNNQVPERHLPTLAQISVFVAEASQQIKDLKGRRFSQIGLALSRLLGHCTCLKELLEMLNNFVKGVALEEQKRMEISQYMVKVQSCYSFMLQFEQYVNSLELVIVDSHFSGEYAEVFVELAWMLFIDSKENYLKSQFHSSSFQKYRCLLASVFYFMIRYSLDYIYPLHLKNQRTSQKRAMVSKILEFLLQIFNIPNIQAYKKIAAKFDQYAYDLINQLALTTVGTDTDFFSPLIIHFNYKQIQNRYQKNLRPKDIDSRVFRRLNSITPIHKQALLYRVGKKKHENKTQSMSRDYKSHRILHYDELQLKSYKFQISSHPFQQQKPQKLTYRIVSGRHQQPCSGSLPQRVNLQIYRYVKALRKFSRKLNETKKQKIQKAIQNTSSEVQRNLALSRQSFELTVYWLYEGVEAQLFSKGLESEEVSMCVLAISFYVVDQMYYQRGGVKSISSYLQNICCQSLIALWQCLNFLEEIPLKLPSCLIRQFECQREEIFCSLIWKEDTFIDQLAELAANFPKQTKFVKFSESVINYAESFYLKLGLELQLHNDHCAYAYNCFKFILSSNGIVLKNRHIDQILLCSVYIAGKISSTQVLFAQIKQAYEALNKEKPQKCQLIFNYAWLREDRTGDIIELYNTQFLQNIQPFVPYMANPSLDLFHPLFQRSIAFQEELDCPNVLSPTSSNLLETKKPKRPFAKINHEKANENINILVQAQRNQTRVRVRPPNYINTSICHTQRNKNTNNNEVQSLSEDEQ